MTFRIITVGHLLLVLRAVAYHSTTVEGREQFAEDKSEALGNFQDATAKTEFLSDSSNESRSLEATAGSEKTPLDKLDRKVDVHVNTGDDSDNFNKDDSQDDGDVDDDDDNEDAEMLQDDKEHKHEDENENDENQTGSNLHPVPRNERKQPSGFHLNPQDTKTKNDPSAQNAIASLQVTAAPNAPLLGNFGTQNWRQSLGKEDTSNPTHSSGSSGKYLYETTGIPEFISQGNSGWHNNKSNHRPWRGKEPGEIQRNGVQGPSEKTGSMFPVNFQEGHSGGMQSGASQGQYGRWRKMETKPLGKFSKFVNNKRPVDSFQVKSGQRVHEEFNNAVAPSQSDKSSKGSTHHRHQGSSNDQQNNKQTKAINQASSYPSNESTTAQGMTPKVEKNQDNFPSQSSPAKNGDSTPSSSVDMATQNKTTTISSQENKPANVFSWHVEKGSKEISRDNNGGPQEKVTPPWGKVKPSGNTFRAGNSGPPSRDLAESYDAKSKETGNSFKSQEMETNPLGKVSKFVNNKRPVVGFQVNSGLRVHKEFNNAVAPSHSDKSSKGSTHHLHQGSSNAHQNNKQTNTINQASSYPSNEGTTAQGMTPKVEKNQDNFPSQSSPAKNGDSTPSSSVHVATENKPTTISSQENRPGNVFSWHVGKGSKEIFRDNNGGPQEKVTHSWGKVKPSRNTFRAGNSGPPSWDLAESYDAKSKEMGNGFKGDTSKPLSYDNTGISTGHSNGESLQQGNGNVLETEKSYPIGDGSDLSGISGLGSNSVHSTKEDTSSKGNAVDGVLAQDQSVSNSDEGFDLSGRKAKGTAVVGAQELPSYNLYTKGSEKMKSTKKIFGEEPSDAHDISVSNADEGTKIYGNIAKGSAGYGSGEETIDKVPIIADIKGKEKLKNAEDIFTEHSALYEQKDSGNHIISEGAVPLKETAGDGDKTGVTETDGIEAAGGGTGAVGTAGTETDDSVTTSIGTAGTGTPGTKTAGTGTSGTGTSGTGTAGTGIAGIGTDDTGTTSTAAGNGESGRATGGEKDGGEVAGETGQKANDAGAGGGEVDGGTTDGNGEVGNGEAAGGGADDGGTNGGGVNDGATGSGIDDGRETGGADTGAEGTGVNAEAEGASTAGGEADTEAQGGGAEGGRAEGDEAGGKAGDGKAGGGADDAAVGSGADDAAVGSGVESGKQDVGGRGDEAVSGDGAEGGRQDGKEDVGGAGAGGADEARGGRAEDGLGEDGKEVNGGSDDGGADDRPAAGGADKADSNDEDRGKAEAGGEDNGRAGSETDDGAEDNGGAHNGRVDNGRPGYDEASRGGAQGGREDGKEDVGGAGGADEARGGRAEDGIGEDGKEDNGGSDDGGADDRSVAGGADKADSNEEDRGKAEAGGEDNGRAGSETDDGAEDNGGAHNGRVDNGRLGYDKASRGSEDGGRTHSGRAESNGGAADGESSGGRTGGKDGAGEDRGAVENGKAESHGGTTDDDDGEADDDAVGGRDYGAENNGGAAAGGVANGNEAEDRTDGSGTAGDAGGDVEAESIGNGRAAGGGGAGKEDRDKAIGGKLAGGDVTSVEVTSSRTASSVANGNGEESNSGVGSESDQVGSGAEGNGGSGAADDDKADDPSAGPGGYGGGGYGGGAGGGGAGGGGAGGGGAGGGGAGGGGAGGGGAGGGGAGGGGAGGGGAGGGGAGGGGAGGAGAGGGGAGAGGGAGGGGAGGGGGGGGGPGGGGSKNAVSAIMDIVFLIDASKTLQVFNYAKVLEFIKAVSKGFTLSFHETRIGVVQFNEDARIMFGFYCCENIKKFDSTVDRLMMDYQPPSPLSNAPAAVIGKGLQLAWYLFNGPTGRRFVPRVLVVVASVTSADDVLGPSKLLRDSGVEIFCVGVGKDYSKTEILHIASLPLFMHVFHLESFSGLQKRAQLIVDRIVRIVQVQTCGVCISDLNRMRSDPYCMQFCQASSPLGSGTMALMKFASNHEPNQFQTSPEAIHLLAHFYPSRLKAIDTFYNVFSQGKNDLNVPLLNGFENGVQSGPESKAEAKYNQYFQKDATSVAMDIIYLVDASSSVGKGNFMSILQFVKDSATKYRISFNEAHVGLITFNDDARMRFGLYCCHSKKELDKSLDDLLNDIKIASPAGPDAPASMMGRGLTLALTSFQGPTARPNVAHVLVVVAATMSADDVYTPSSRLAASGVNVFGIGVGKDFSRLDLAHIASAPMFRHLFKLGDYSQFKQRHELIVDRIIRDIQVKTCGFCTDNAAHMFSNPYCIQHCQAGATIGEGGTNLATASFSSPRNAELTAFAHVLSHRYPKRMRAFDGFLINEAQHVCDDVYFEECQSLSKHGLCHSPEANVNPAIQEFCRRSCGHCASANPLKKSLLEKNNKTKTNQIRSKPKTVKEKGKKHIT